MKNIQREVGETANVLIDLGQGLVRTVVKQPILMIILILGLMSKYLKFGVKIGK